MTEALSVTGLNAWRGTAHVLQDVSLTVASGRLALIGRNGMGKTTLCEAVVGLLASQPGNRVTGRVAVCGRDVSGLPPHRVARSGVGYVPQGRRIFPSLSTLENLRIVQRRKTRWTIDRVFDLFPRLHERERVGAGQLSGGEQQMLAVGRALLTNPALLVMDEPTEGLAPTVIEQLVAALRRLDDENMHVLLVEQNLAVATALADRLVVLANGRVVAELDAATLLADSTLQERFLGVAPPAP